MNVIAGAVSESRRVLETSDGIVLTYWLSRQSESAGRVVLLVHGLGSNHTRWSEFVDETSLTVSWDLLRPDLRGNGESLSREKHGMREWCRDLIEILDAEGYTDAIVVGHSLGAQIALHLAALAPARVAGLVLIDPVFRRALLGKQGFYARNPWLLRGAAGLVHSCNRMGIYRRHIPHRDLRELDEETREALGGDEAFEVIAKRYSALGPVLRHMPIANGFRQMAAMVGPLPDLAAIEMPVVVLGSGGITFADKEINKEEMSRFPDCEVVTLNANHWPLTETPEETRRVIEEWIGRTFAE